MKRFARGAVVLATIPLLMVGIATAALASGSHHGTCTTAMQAMDDQNCRISDPDAGTTMRAFDDANWVPAAQEPINNPNVPIAVQNPAGQPAGSVNNLPVVALIASLAALAAAGALVTIARRQRLRPA